jgi:hypothetical protein
MNDGVFALNGRNKPESDAVNEGALASRQQAFHRADGDFQFSVIPPFAFFRKN